MTVAWRLGDPVSLEDSWAALLPDPDLAQTLTLLELLESKAPVGFGFVDRDFRVVRMNETLALVNGSTVAAQLGHLVADLVPEIWPQLEPLYRGVLDSGEAVLDIAIDGPSAEAPGTHHWLASYYPVVVGDAVIGVGVVVVDVTQRQRAEHAGRELAAIVNGSGDAIFGAANNGTVTSWNPAAERLFGYTAEQILGQSLAVLLPPSHVDQQQVLARIKAGGSAERLETTRRRRDGSLVDVQINASPVIDGSGMVVGISAIAHDVTQARAVREALETSQRQLTESQRIADLGSSDLDLVTGQLTWSDQLYIILGLDPSQEPSVELHISTTHPDDRAVLRRAWADAAERGVPFELDYRIIRPDSSVRSLHTRAVPVLHEDGTVVKVCSIVLDETERVAAERARASAEARFESGFEQAGIGSAIFGLDGMPLRVNPATCALLGRPKEELVGRRWTEFTHPDEIPMWRVMQTPVAAREDGYADERRYVRPDGSIVWASVHVTIVKEASGQPQYLLAQLQDITERKQMEGELAHQSLHDSLTGLANRTLLTDRLIQGLARTRRQGSQLAVLLLDVDHFKVVNDSLGHAGGDDLLRHAGQRLSLLIRQGDTVARFGGDEFVLVCDGLSGLETERVAARVLEALAEPFHVEGQEIHVTASLGIAVSDDQATPESLLRDADAAMYVAKRRGRGRAEMFDEELRANAEGRLVRVSALRHALDRDEFIVHYQPVVDLSTGTMVSAEALLRWEHPDRGLVSPVDFIPFAEETGQIVPIGAWVLEQACRQLVEWQRHQPSMTVAVNLSVRQLLAPDLIAMVKDVLARTGARPESLCLELTESVFMEDVEYFAATLARLKELGVRLSIDDFGTGYSSLSYLKRFPFDAVKVDRSFVDGLGTDPHDSALVVAIIAMAKALDLEVTAEGVETQEQLTILNSLHCQRAQGYHLGRPMPAADLDVLVSDSHHWDVD